MPPKASPGRARRRPPIATTTCACTALRRTRRGLTLLGADRIAVELSDEDQLWPEQSTSAIVLHHPQARYFNV